MVTWLETMGWMLVCATTCVGVGAMLLGLFEGTRLEPWRCFWAGLIGAMPLAAGWHLVLPLDGFAALALAALAAAGYAQRWRALVDGTRRVVRTRPVAVAIFAIAWVAAPWLALQPLTCIDSGLYYVAAVEWHRGFAQVPGLQATSPLSTMNSSAFHLMALAGTGPFAGLGHVTFNLTLAWWGLPAFVAALEGLPRRWSHAGLVTALAAAPAIDVLSTDRMSCPSADVGVAWLGMALIPFALGSARGSRGPVLLLVLLAPMFKLSLAPLTLVLVGFMLLRDRATFTRSELARVAGGCAAAWLPVLAGNLITSGYPFYPAAVGGISASWALPHGLVLEVGEVIRSYATHDGVAGETSAGQRIERLLLLNRGVLVPALLGALGAILVTVRLWRERAERALLLGALALGAFGWLFWFISAPDPRFAGAMLWAIGGLAVALGLGATSGAAMALPTTRWLWVLGVTVLVLGDVPFMAWPRTVGASLPAIPAVPESDWVTLEDGTRIIDGTPLGMKPPTCWAVPCAAVYPRGLRRRDPADLSKGFSLPPDAHLPPLSMK